MCVNDIIKIFTHYISQILNHEAFYLIQKLSERYQIDKNVINHIPTHYFDHWENVCNKGKFRIDPSEKTFFEKHNELSKNNWELHKQLVKGGVNPNEFAKIIRNDDIEKLQEITSQTNFDFNQRIPPSLYEKCSFISYYVKLIDYAAFFGSAKCFKQMLLNGANVNNTGNYAVAGGNDEIIHLSEQNNSSFEESYEAAIKYHRNDIFKYIYENKLEDLSEEKIEKLECLCVRYGNYQILSYFKEKGYNIIKDSIKRISKNWKHISCEEVSPKQSNYK